MKRRFGPMRSVDRVADHARRGGLLLNGGKQSGPAEFSWKILMLARVRVFDEPIDLLAAVVVDEIQLARVVHAEGDQLQRSIGQFD